ncbi:MAG: RNHCP domain-containing protein [Myxococcota bacterium]
MDSADRARALLEAARTRGDIRRLAAQLDADPALRRAVIAEGRRRGVDFGDDVSGFSAKRVLRLARGREATSRARHNPIARDEGFVCEHCAESVPPHGRTARNHCPHCLRSKHVDEVPGDRASACGGLMDPVSVELVAGHPVLHQRCRLCGHEGRVRAVLDGVPPDRWSVIAELSSRGSR